MCPSCLQRKHWPNLASLSIFFWLNSRAAARGMLASGTGASVGAVAKAKADVNWPYSGCRIMREIGKFWLANVVAWAFGSASAETIQLEDSFRAVYLSWFAWFQFVFFNVCSIRWHCLTSWVRLVKSSSPVTSCFAMEWCILSCRSAISVALLWSRFCAKCWNFTQNRLNFLSSCRKLQYLAHKFAMWFGLPNAVMKILNISLAVVNGLVASARNRGFNCVNAFLLVWFWM